MQSVIPTYVSWTIISVGIGVKLDIITVDNVFLFVYIVPYQFLRTYNKHDHFIHNHKPN